MLFDELSYSDYHNAALANTQAGAALLANEAELAADRGEYDGDNERVGNPR